jgi:hypothetical protein
VTNLDLVILLEGDLIVGLAVGAPVTSSWIIVKRLGLSFMEPLKWLWSLASPKWKKSSHKERVFVLRGIGLEKKMSLCGVRDNLW